MGKSVKCTVIFCLLLLIILACESSPLWADWVLDGVPVCTADTTQKEQQIISDGAGGAIITWQDFRNGTDYDIYAQRIDYDGNTLWSANGVAICTAGDDQRFPKIAADSCGGAFIAWVDERNMEESKADIYVQRIDSSGTIHIGWVQDGNPVCTEPGHQGGYIWCKYRLFSDISIISDGAGGAIITWMDGRRSVQDIYAQRIDASGDTLWTGNGVAVCETNNDQFWPKLVSDGAGGAIITWQDRRRLYPDFNDDIYAQLINAGGDAVWMEDGVVICKDTLSTQFRPQITSDGSGGAIIVWSDMRGPDTDIYAQRVDANGFTQWTDDGVVVCAEPGDQGDPGDNDECDYYFFRLTTDDSGGAIIAWEDQRHGETDIYAQRIDADGNHLWDNGGIAICTYPKDQTMVAIVSDGFGEATITWFDKRRIPSEHHYDVYTQRIDADGVELWAEDGVPVCTSGGAARPQMISDGLGGAIITYQDSRSGNLDIYAMCARECAYCPIATLLQSFHVSLIDNYIEITWTLSESAKNMKFFVFRTEAASATFKEITDPGISNEGLTFSFRDETCKAGATYRYRIEVSDEAGRRILFKTDQIATPVIPLTLYQNHPNPFNPSTTVKYYLPRNCRAILSVYDVSGRRIACLVDKKQNEGHHMVEWNGRDMKGNLVSSGTYLYRLMAEKEMISRKMILLR